MLNHSNHSFMLKPDSLRTILQSNFFDNSYQSGPDALKYVGTVFCHIVIKLIFIKTENLNRNVQNSDSGQPK